MTFADHRGLDAQSSSTGAVLESSDNSDRPLTEGENLLWDPKQQASLLYDEPTAQQTGFAYFMPHGTDWVVDESQVTFVQGTAPAPAAPTQSILERYRTGVFNGLMALPRSVKEAGAQTVDMITMAAAIAAQPIGSTQEPWHTCWSNTCEAYGAGVPQSALLYDATVGLVERPARAAAKAITLDPEALGELVGSAGAYGVGDWLKTRVGRVVTSPTVAGSATTSGAAGDLAESSATSTRASAAAGQALVDALKLNRFGEFASKETAAAFEKWSRASEATLPRGIFPDYYLDKDLSPSGGGPYR